MWRWRVTQVCPEVEADESAPVTFESMSGLFIICGGIAVFAVLFAIIKSVAGFIARCGKPMVPEEIELDHTATEGERRWQWGGSHAHA